MLYQKSNDGGTAGPGTIEAKRKKDHSVELSHCSVNRQVPRVGGVVVQMAPGVPVAQDLPLSFTDKSGHIYLTHKMLAQTRS